MTIDGAVPMAGPAAATGVTVRFWAGAKAAAGTESVLVPAGAVTAIREHLVEWRSELAPVLGVSSLLVDGGTVTDADIVPAGCTLEVLPPFAGG